jgi:hypothetical protein
MFDEATTLVYLRTRTVYYTNRIRRVQFTNRYSTGFTPICKSIDRIILRIEATGKEQKKSG